MSALNKVWLIGEDACLELLNKQWPDATFPKTGIVHIGSISQLYQRLLVDIPEFVFLDLNLPGVANPDFLCRVDEILLGAPVIVLGTSNDEAIAQEAIDAGAQDFLIKDEINKNHLERMIRFSCKRQSNKHVLQESEERFRVLIESAPEALIVFDYEKGNFITASQSAERLFKMTRQELLSTGPVAVSPEFQPCGTSSAVLAEAWIRKAIQGGNPKFEWVHIDSEGRPFLCDVTLVRLPSSETTLIRGTMVDITERKKIEEEFRKTHDRYEKLVNNIDGIVWEADTETFMFTFVSAQAERILGYPIEKWYEPSFWENKIYPEDRGWAVAYCAHQTALGLGHEFEYRMIAANGSVVWLRDIVTVVPREGRPPLIRGIMVDIGSRKKVEEMLQNSSEQLRQLTAHLQHIREEERLNIAREIHDELGQQLTVMKMDISWLQKKIMDPDELVNRKMSDLIDVIDDTVRTVRKISSDLRPSMLDDLGLVAALEWHCGEFQKRSGIRTRFTTDLNEVTLPFESVTGMYRIFQESLTNVARHAEATRVEASLQAEFGRLIMTINDNGKGFSVNDTDKKRTLGILGMRERTVIMKGDYSITSAPGMGTTVKVLIPFANIE